MGVLPLYAECFIYLYVLAGFDTSSAENALIRIISVEGIGHVHFIWFGFIGRFLMFNVEKAGRIVDSTVTVIVVTDCAVQQMIAKNSIEGFELSCAGLRGKCQHIHAGRCRGSTCPDEFAIN